MRSEGFIDKFSEVSYTANNAKMFRQTVVIFCLAITALGNPVLIPRLDDKIVGGQETIINAFPYQASLRFENQHICGGSIIDETTILTAAHCIHEMDPDGLSVRVGSTTQGWNGQLLLVSHIIEHSEYNPTTLENDIALIRLSKPIKFNLIVEPVQLPEINTVVKDGTKAVVTGWGVTAYNSNTISENLRKVTLSVINNKQCEADYAGRAAVASSMLCAVSPGKDSCQGDSGGPLVANGKQVGIVSWGFGCADPASPGVYTRVSAFSHWIQINKGL